MILGQWIDQTCEISDNIPQKNGLELAPTSFDDLFYSYKEWCQDKVINHLIRRKLRMMS